MNPKAPIASNCYSASAEPHEQAKDDGDSVAAEAISPALRSDALKIGHSSRILVSSYSNHPFIMVDR